MVLKSTTCLISPTTCSSLLSTHILPGTTMAIKTQKLTPQTLLLHPQLKYEPKIYKTLAGSVSVPFVRWFGTKCDYNVMVLNLLGLFLKDLFNLCNCKFGLKMVLLLTGQLVMSLLLPRMPFIYCSFSGIVDFLRQVHPFSQLYPL